MNELTEAQVDFIHTDLQKKGLPQKQLTNELLEHICVLTELEMQSGLAFNEAYQKALQYFGKGGLQKVNDETEEYDNYPKFITKKFLWWSGIVLLCYYAIGIYARLNQWADKKFWFIGSSSVIAYVFLPLLLSYMLLRSNNKLKTILEFLLLFLLLHNIVFFMAGLRHKWISLSLFIVVLLIYLIGFYVVNYFEKRRKL
jgi:hypothetical protein